MLKFHKLKKSLFKGNYQFGRIKNLIRNITKKYIDKLQQKQPQGDLINYEEKKIPMNMAEKQNFIVEKQFQNSIVESERLKQIDEILGTKTYFQHTKFFQKRLDSQHIMSIQKLKRSIQSKRNKIIAQIADPQKPQNLVIRNRKIYNQKMIKLRQYPYHSANINIQDLKSPQTISFLGKQILYTRLSFKQVQTMKSTFLQEQINLPNQSIVTSKNIYFLKKGQAAIYSAAKEVLQKYERFQLIPHEQLNQVITLSQFYEQLRKYDEDLRVQSFLKKVQNQEISYMIYKMIWSETQRYLGFIIDLTGDNTNEYCLFIKDMVQGNLYKQIFFNIDTDALIHKNHLIFKKLDQFGNFRILSRFNIETKTNQIIFQEKQQHNISIQIDPSLQVFYLYRNNLSNDYKQKVYVFGFQNTFEFIKLLDYPGCQYKIFKSKNGFYYSKFIQNINDQANILEQNYSKQIYLIPYVQEKKLMNYQAERKLQKIQNLKDFIQQFNELSDKKIKVPQAKKKKILSEQHELIFVTNQNQYIKDIIKIKSHLVTIVMTNWKHQFNYQKFIFLPEKQNVDKTQLLFKNSKLRFKTYRDYTEQKIGFTIQNLLETQYKYNIWKKQLSQVNPDTFHMEQLTFKTNDNYQINLQIYCQSRYLGRTLPSVIFFPTTNQTIQIQVLMSLLKKGVLICLFKGRGSLNGNQNLFKNGTKQNIFKSVSDLNDTAKFLLEKKLSDNLTLYCKGSFSGLVGLYSNIIEPQLFTATALHNGVYDLKNKNLYEDYIMRKMFGDINNVQIAQFWKKYSPLQLKFKNSLKFQEGQTQLIINSLQNILFTQDLKQSYQTRKFIYYLRNSKRKYQEVYYQQSINQKQTDLQNCCYLWRSILNNSYYQSF